VLVFVLKESKEFLRASRVIPPLENHIRVVIALPADKHFGTGHQSETGEDLWVGIVAFECSHRWYLPDAKTGLGTLSDVLGGPRAKRHEQSYKWDFSEPASPLPRPYPNP